MIFHFVQKGEPKFFPQYYWPVKNGKCVFLLYHTKHLGWKKVDKGIFPLSLCVPGMQRLLLGWDSNALSMLSYLPGLALQRDAWFLVSHLSSTRHWPFCFPGW